MDQFQAGQWTLGYILYIQVGYIEISRAGIMS